MSKHNFKIGDKVKACGPLYEGGVYIHTEGTGIIGEVIEVGRLIHVQWDTNKCIVCGKDDCGILSFAGYHRPQEIEHVVKVNEQLLFSFMTP